jgi:hypothetical protein
LIDRFDLLASEATSLHRSKVKADDLVPEAGTAHDSHPMNKITPSRLVSRCVCNAGYERMFDALRTLGGLRRSCGD